MARRDRPRTISIAADDRARVPFAMVGVFLLLTSVSIVGVLNLRTQPETDTDVSVAMDQAFAGAQSEVRDAVQTAAQDAAKEPVTESADLASTPAGNAIADLSDTEDEVFRNYVKLRIYLEAQRKLTSSTQEVGQVRTETSLPETHYTEQSVKQAINSVDLRTGLDSGTSMKPGTLEVTIDDLTATAYDESGRVGSRTEDISVTVASTVFPLHHKVETYEQRLNSGSMSSPNTLRTQAAARLYPLAWAKAGYERFRGSNPTPAADAGGTFHSVVENREVAVLGNSAIFSVQHRTFGTKDPNYAESMAPAWVCLASKTVSKVASSSSRANRLADGACTATGFLFTDKSFPMPSSISGLLNGVSSSTKNKTYATRRTVTTNITKFAYPAYKDVADEPIDWTDPSNPLREDWSGSEYDDRRRPPNSSDTQSDETLPPTDELTDGEDLVREALDDIYTAQASYTASTSSGSLPERTNPGSGEDWNKLDDDTEWGSSDVEVTNLERKYDDGALPRDITYYEATVQVTREAKDVERWEECTNRNETTGECENWESDTYETGWEDVEYTLSFTIEGTRSRNADVQARGVETAVDEGGSPNPYSGGVPANFDTLPEEAVSRTTTIDLADGEQLTEAKLRSAVNADDVESGSDIRNQVLDRQHVEWSPSPRNEDQLVAWLERDLRHQLYPRIVQDVDPIELTMVEMIQSDNPYESFLTELDRRDAGYIYDGSGSYSNVPALVRAEARHRYLQEIDNWIQDINERTQNSEDNANDELQGETSIDEGMANAQRFLGDGGSISLPETTSPGTVDTELMGDIEFRVKGAPSYLSTKPVMATTVPAVRPAGEGPEDPENTVHAPFASKVSGGPMPGLPIAPLPGYWVASVNAWDVQFKGEYARFSVTARTGTPSGSKATTYVRQEQPVYVTINDIDRRVGKVPALNFSNNVPIVVAMPGATVMPKGTLGTGERAAPNSPKHQFTECSASWSFIGPGYTMRKRTPSPSGGAHGDRFACYNQKRKHQSGSPMAQVLMNPSSSGVTKALADVAEDELEEMTAGPTNIVSEDDDDDLDEIEETGLPDSKLTVEFLDPGENGAAILVRREVADDSSGENKTMLIDTGDYGEENDIVQKLRDRNVEEIDYLVVTHNHTDHIGGLILNEHTRFDKDGLLSVHEDGEITIENLYFNGITAESRSGGPSREQSTLQDELRGMSIDRERLTTGEGWKLAMGSEVDIDVLNPPGSPRTECDQKPDCNSIVMKISKDGHHFLLTSDIREDVEKDLADEFGAVDVLQLAHHGGARSNGEALTNLEFDVSVFTGGDRDWRSGTNVDFTPAYVTTDTDVTFVVTEDGEFIGPRERVLTTGDD